MRPTQLHSYLLWRSSVKPDQQALAWRRITAAVSLVPAIMVGVFVFGWYAGLVLLVTLGAAFATDMVCHRLWREALGTRDGTWIVTGLLLGLMMPPNVPLWLPAIGAVLAVYLGKYFLAVEDTSWLQPAAVGLLVLHLIGWGGMNGLQDGQPHWPTLTRSAVASGTIREGGPWRLVRGFFGGDVRKSVTQQERREAAYRGEPVYFDKQNKIEAQAEHGPRPLDIVKAAPARPLSRVPDGSRGPRYEWLDLVLGYVPATIGGASALALGLGVLLLIFTGAGSWQIPVFGLATMFGGLHLLSWMYGGGSDARVISANIPFHLLTGSTLLGLFYLAADPAVEPRSALGKAYAGIAFGVIEVVLRIFTPLAEGVFVTIVLVQALSFVFDQWLAPVREERPAANVGLSSSSLGRL